MTKTAYMFPGQGAQFVPMGRDLYESFAVCRSVFDRAESACGLPIKKLCFEGPLEELSQTNFSQPALVATSIAALAAARETRLTQPDFMFGLSLGEYSALCAAGALSLEDTVRLVKIRGEAMQQAALQNPGGMSSIIGASHEDVLSVVEKASKFGVIGVANFNSPGQIVISGQISALDEADKLAAQLPRVRAIRLNVSGAFHSPLMKPAADILADAVEKFEWHEPCVPIVSNVSAEPVTNIPQIKANIIAQLTGSVLFDRSVVKLAELGVTKYIEIGPSKVLVGLLRRIDRNLIAVSKGTAEEVRLP